MNIIEKIKEKTLRLIGLILIAIPLMVCYPTLLYIGMSVEIASIATVCLTIIAYILLVTHIELLLGRMLPFLALKTKTDFIPEKSKTVDTYLQIAQEPSSYVGISDLETLLTDVTARETKGNWVYS